MRGSSHHCSGSLTLANRATLNIICLPYKPDLEEDFDATQLEEELIDPPELEAQASAPVPAQQTQQQQQPQQQQPQYQQPQYNTAQHAGGQNGQDYGNGFGVGVNQDGIDGLDRIRPSDMPDEGLVVSSSLTFVLYILLDTENIRIGQYLVLARNIATYLYCSLLFLGDSIKLRVVTDGKQRCYLLMLSSKTITLSR